MDLKIVLFTLITCVVQIKSENCENLQENLRMKRSKYYHYPQRFYRPPPNAHTIKGPYSYTPPPSYMNDDRPAIPSRPPKVSRQEGLGDDDITNLVKYLSKKDLDKIIEFAGEREGYRSEYRPNYSRPKEIDDEKFSLNGPFNLEEQSHIRDTHPRILNNPPDTYESNPDVNYINDDSQQKVIYSKPPDTPNVYNPTYLNTPFEPQETKVNYKLSNSPVHQISNIVKQIDAYKEEQLPRPVNLREDEEYEVSFTNNVPSVVKGDSSYKLENFGDLPVMNYQNSKLHSVSSYNVPHYTITGQSQPPLSSHQSSQNTSPLLELAPAGATGREQSDAHLKAIKIWTHRSKGTAYTLHKDGTLSLERPRPRPYGHP